MKKDIIGGANRDDKAKLLRKKLERLTKEKERIEGEIQDTLIMLGRVLAS